MPIKRTQGCPVLIWTESFLLDILQPDFMPENPPTINDLRRFEDAIRRRNPRLAEALQPGLARHMINSVLQSAAVTGDPSPVLDIFSWRNGTKMTPAMT